MDKFELAKLDFDGIKPQFNDTYVSAMNSLKRIEKKSTKKWVVEIEKRKFILYVNKLLRQG